MKNLFLMLAIAFSITTVGQIDPTTLKATIDTDITTKTGANSISKANVGNNMKSIVDYATQVGITKVSKVTLSSSDLLNLYSTPITLVPAVTGKVLVIQSIYQNYLFGTTVYNNVNTCRIGYGDIATGYINFGILIYNSSDINGVYSPIVNIATTTNYSNLPLVLASTIGSPVDGDGILELYVVYTEIKI